MSANNLITNSGLQSGGYRRKALVLLAVLLVWILVYTNLKPVTDWLVDRVFGLESGKHMTEALWFFIFEVPKVLLLLVLIIFFVGIIRTFFTPERTRKALEGKSLFAGNVLAAMLGIVTPFCSCSAIPLFLGFMEAGVPLGVTFSFLIAAPMINEVAVILLFGMFGWKVALIYVLTGLILAILAGWIIGKLKLEKWVESWVYSVKSGQPGAVEERPDLWQRVRFGLEAVKEIVGKVWIYIVIGIAVGAAAHGFVPEKFMTELMGESTWYSVPLSILIGVPLYSNAAGIIPIVSVLIEKGVPLGTALAFMMSVIGLSLPEMIILRKVLKLKLIFVFVGIVTLGIIIVGYLFNMIY
ncbi:MAG: permease [Bacteroidales bacterium]